MTDLNVLAKALGVKELPIPGWEPILGGVASLKKYDWCADFLCYRTNSTPEERLEFLSHESLYSLVFSKLAVVGDDFLQLPKQEEIEEVFFSIAKLL